MAGDSNKPDQTEQVNTKNDSTVESDDKQAVVMDTAQICQKAMSPVKTLGLDLTMAVTDKCERPG